MTGDEIKYKKYQEFISDYFFQNRKKNKGSLGVFPFRLSCKFQVKMYAKVLRESCL